MKSLSTNEGQQRSFSGVPRMKNAITGGLFVLTMVYALLVYLMRDSGSYLTPANEFCATDLGTSSRVDDDKPCSRPDLFAFQVSSGLAIAFCGVTGFYTWHISKRVHTHLPRTPEGRLFGFLPESEKLAAANFTFQFWDFCISLLIPEHCTALMLCHHIMAAIVSWCSLDNQYLHYYGVFFLGLSEASSVALVFVDLGTYFPPSPGTLPDIWINMLCGPLFAVCFIFYRVVLWWKISWQLWRDAIYVIRNDIAEQLRPGRSFVLYIFLGLNLPLGILQLYWLTIILEEVRKVVVAVQVVSVPGPGEL